MVVEKYGTAVAHIGGLVAPLDGTLCFAAFSKVSTIVVGGFTAKHATLWNSFGLQDLANGELPDEIETTPSRLEEDVKCQEHQRVFVTTYKVIAPHVPYGGNIQTDKMGNNPLDVLLSRTLRMLRIHT